MNTTILGAFAIIGIAQVLRWMHIWMFHSVNWYWRCWVRRQNRRVWRSDQHQTPKEYKELSAFVLSCLRTESLNVMDWNNMHIYAPDEVLLTAFNKRCHPEVYRSVQQAFTVNWLEDFRTLTSRQCG